MSVTEEIKSRLDIVSYIQQYVPLKKAGRHYKANCPFHSEKSPSFVVNADTQSWRCFGACAEGGDVFSFAMKHHGWTFSEALEQLGAMAGIEVRKQSPLDKQRAERHQKLYGLLATAADIYHKTLVNPPSAQAQQTLDYVQEKRGLSDATIRNFAIGFAPPGWQNMLDDLTNLGYDLEDLIETGLVLENDSGRIYDRFRNRLMIPIRDERGRIIGFGARALDPDDQPKYLNSPQTPLFDKSHVLFGLDVAKRSIRDTETAVIVEGYMDVIQAHQAGFTNVIAQMGTALTETQLKKLVPRYTSKIIMALDADAAGQNATRRSLETARQTLEADYAGRLSVDIRVLQIPGAKDPDDLIRESPEQWQSLVENALPVADFVIEMEAAALHDSATIQEREAVARRLLPILAASESDLYRQDNLQRLARRLRIPERDLLRWASEHAPAPSKRSASSMPDEPPPLDYDSMIVPPDADAADYEPATSGISNGSVVVRDSALESRCLRMLIEHPEMFYQVNRKFRELAMGNLLLRQGPLSDLSASDFMRSDYRMLMTTFLTALMQHDVEIVDYLRGNVDAVLHDELDRLLLGEDASIQQQIKRRFSADFEIVWKQHNRVNSLDEQTIDRELVIKALQLRRDRLRREGDEYRFQQIETQQGADEDEKIRVLTQARQLIEAELEEQQRFFTG